MPKKLKEKQTPVTRKFLNDLARSIYNPTTRRFLRLCKGTLQNGPDPTDKKRSMHCGLGELYFAMTGLQPEETGIDEDGVVAMAVARSPLQSADELRQIAAEGVKKLKLPKGVKETMLEALDEMDGDYLAEDAEDFKSTLDDIPGQNDSCGDSHACTTEDFRTRSQRVAAKLREAAKILPV